jgi:hypothetical protein
VSSDPTAPRDPSAAADPAAADPAGSGPAGAPGPDAQPSEAELRAAYEAELARITSTDLMLQAAVSLLNVGSYRLMPPPASGEEQSPPGGGRDLEQARDAIDGVRALVEILERRVPSELRPLRDALSQLQMAYAREVQASGGATGGGEQPAGGAGPGGGQQPAGDASGEPSGGDPGAPGGPAPGGAGQQPGQGPSEEEQGRRGPGPAESSGRLWVPGR